MGADNMMTVTPPPPKSCGTFRGHAELSCDVWVSSGSATGSCNGGVCAKIRLNKTLSRKRLNKVQSPF